MTGKGLLRRLLRNLHHKRRYESCRVVPLGARVVMGAVCDLIADSGEAQVFRLDPELDDEMTVAAAVTLAAEIRGISAEAEVEAHMAALVRAGLLVRSEDGALSLPLPVPAITQRRAESARTNGSGGGRPRQGETAEEARARRHAQRSMPLMSPIDGGRNAQRETQETQFGNPSETQRETQAGSEPGYPPGSYRVSEYSSAAAAAESTSTNSTPSAAAAAAGTGYGILAETRRETQPRTQDETKTETQAETQARVSGPAQELAGYAAGKHRFAPEYRADAPRVFQEILDMGYPPATVRGWIEHRPVQPATVSAQFYLQKARSRVRPGAAPSGGEASAGSHPDGVIDLSRLHPEVFKVELWKRQPDAAKRAISRVLAALDIEAEGDRRRALGSNAQFNREAFDLVGAERPEIYALVGEETPGRPAQAAAG